MFQSLQNSNKANEHMLRVYMKIHKFISRSDIL